MWNAQIIVNTLAYNKSAVNQSETTYQNISLLLLQPYKLDKWIQSIYSVTYSHTIHFSPCNFHPVAHSYPMMKFFALFVTIFAVTCLLSPAVVLGDLLDHFGPEVREFVQEIQNDEIDPTSRDASTLVTIQNGTIQGIITRSIYSFKPIYTYKAIPFAAPPNGSLRFEVRDNRSFSQCNNF